MTVNDIVTVTQGQYSQTDSPEISQQTISSVVIDSRAIVAGSLFVALQGEHVDGHDFLSQALEQGAAVALVERKQTHAIAQIVVPSCVEALAQLAKYWRQQFVIPFIAITGSCGKTSSKEMLASILSLSSAVSVTAGNQNNELGVPLTLFNTLADSDYSIVEMGAAQQGDIRYLMNMAEPDVTVITNVRSAHIGRFGSVEIIAETKAEIYTELKAGATAAVNLDEEYAPQWLKQLQQQKQKVISYALKNDEADIYASNVDLGLHEATFELHVAERMQRVTLPALGMHSVYNALCASACATAVGVDIAEIAQGLACYQGVSSRMQVLPAKWGGELIDDSYNASPASVEAAIDVLAKFPGKKHLVLGDMAELGDASQQSHEQVGLYAAQAGIDVLFSCGVDSVASSKAFTAESQHFAEKKQLLTVLQQQLKADDVVLIKGSRSAGLEFLVNALKAEVGE